MSQAFVFYQYFFPDQNISSVHLSELSADLAARGWDVTAFPCNRDLDRPEETLPARGEWRGVKIRRLWRPRISRTKASGRLVTAVWMIVHWSFLALRPKLKPDVLIVGTDPIFSVMVSAIWKVLRPRTKIVHWCFDLYPEAAYADGLIRKDRFLARVLEVAIRYAYNRCDVIVDIGICMRGLIQKYGNAWKSSTLVPWAMSEPSGALPVPPSARLSVFGSAKLGLMYSGSFGRAHSFDDVLQLMQLVEGKPISLSVSVKGQRESQLRELTANRPNIAWHPLAPREGLNDRLAAADIHIVSLREEWTGTVVPSKFFGALAVGRPVLFCGSEDSSIAGFIRAHRIGWVLTSGKAAEVAAELTSLLDFPETLLEMRARCHRVYHDQFSRKVICEAWHELLVDCDQPSTAAQMSLLRTRKSQSPVSER